MAFLKEPPFTHGKAGKIAVLLVNLGTPDAPTTKAVRRYPVFRPIRAWWKSRGRSGG